MATLSPLQLLPGGGIGTVRDVRPLPGGNPRQDDGRALAAVTVDRPNPTRPGAVPSPRLGGETLTVVQDVSVTELPPGTPGRAREMTRAGVSPGPDGAPPGAPLDTEDQATVARLRARDGAVRAEEMSHKLLAGPNAGSIQYEYQRGPDGRLYAVGGRVPIVPVAGLTGLAAIANEIALRGAAAVPGTSSADSAALRAGNARLAELIQADLANQAYVQAGQAPLTARLRIDS